MRAVQLYNVVVVINDSDEIQGQVEFTTREEAQQATEMFNAQEDSQPDKTEWTYVGKDSDRRV